ncbi:hypothetical protein LNKW23_09030 [Paralimibaculum aggregatum]|uniref:Lysozyme inhibitor LprI N-terminal domain-containing protein n=1 Tax=Paralimibaculum aggregatum TaxID=3036245 RepID=A0ABQ6LEB4_9RHOB|nr:hypothetical protein [Limibaculum sp. NKW23]GMG81690.1 hypothetical protein LNKW23_09030 [Limibaculum sp. NKW23]
MNGGWITVAGIALCALLAGGMARAGDAAADPAPCRQEALAAARAACIDLATEQLLNAVEADLERFGAGAQAADPAALEGFLGEARAAQRGWRAGLAGRCPGRGLAPARCRHAAAARRAEELDRLIADGRARLGIAAPYAGYRPRLEIHPGRAGRFGVEVIIDAPAP